MSAFGALYYLGTSSIVGVWWGNYANVVGAKSAVVARVLWGWGWMRGVDMLFLGCF